MVELIKHWILIADFNCISVVIGFMGSALLIGDVLKIDTNTL